MKQLNIVKYQTKELEIDVLIDYEKETVWLTTDQIAKLFEKSKQNISKHINNIFKNNEANELSTVNYYLTVASNGKTYNIKHYNLEIVTLVGNKINSTITNEFREFIDKEIKEYKKTHKRYELVKFIDNSLENTIELDVNVDPAEETVWLTLEDMSILFDRDRSVIGKHIKRIYREKELNENTTRAKNARHLPDERVYYIDIYNLDVILSVGYRVNSKRGIVFRKWANKILKEYLVDGFAINTKRVLSVEDNYNNLMKQVNELTTYNINFNNKLENVDNRLKVVENKITEYDLPIEKIIYNGEYYDAYTLIQTIFESAMSGIIIETSFYY